MQFLTIVSKFGANILLFFDICKKKGDFVCILYNCHPKLQQFLCEKLNIIA